MGQFGAATEPDTEPNWNPDELRLKIAKHAEALVRGMRRIDPDFAPSVDGEDASHGGATPLPPHKS